MKKTYMVPALSEQRVQTEQMLAGSITGVGGDAGIGLADDPTAAPPAEGDVKGNFYGESIFD